jgi:hypothetical protein
MWMKKSIDSKVEQVKAEAKAIKQDAIFTINERERYLRRDLNRHERSIERLSDKTGMRYSKRESEREEEEAENSS